VSLGVIDPEWMIERAPFLTDADRRILGAKYQQKLLAAQGAPGAGGEGAAQAAPAA
jgi:hypothetical protein